MKGLFNLSLNAFDLLSHARNASKALFMYLMVLLVPYELVCRLLCKEFNGYPLVIHGNFRLSANISSGHCITHRSRPVFIFLDIAYQLVSSLYINLSSLDNLLQNFGVFLCQLLHLTLPGPVLTPLLLKLSALRIVSISIFFDGFSGVFGLNLLKLLTMVVERL